MAAGAHNLPAPLTSLVGRARELDRVAETLRRTRLITLAGPGGVGKTRVALELARRQVGRRSDGVWVIDLTAVAASDDVAAETARTLDVRGVPALDALRRYLAHRDVLLVLDNCEHVVGAAAQVARDLLTSCGGVRILATSRESLGVDGETVWRLEPLRAEDAHRLFVERARQRRPEFVPTRETDVTIAELCARLDRLPLAIELAAAQLAVMSPEEVLAGLKRRLDSVAGGGRLAPPHHRTVRAVVQWSHQLLGADEQEALHNLAVFVGGFDAAAAAAVAPGLSIPLLARLVDKSLVAVADSPRGRTRYHLLETVREFARERLDEAGALNAARERHLRHFAQLAETAREEWLTTGVQRFVNQLDDDYENVRAALEWATDTDPCAALRTLAGIRDLFFRFGQADGLRIAEVLLERCDTRDRYRAEGLIATAQLAISLGQPQRGFALLTEARELTDEPVLVAWAGFFQGLAETLAGAWDSARDHLEASRALHHDLGIRVGEARAVAVLGMTYLMADEPAPAQELLEAALALNEQADERWGQGQCHNFLGLIAADERTATAHFRKAVALLRPSRDATLLPVALIGQAGVLVRRDPESALKLVGAASALRARVGGEFAPYYRRRLQDVEAAANAALGPAAQAARAQGARLGLDEAIAVAFGRPAPRSAPETGLSVRELEVAALVSQGLSNKAIAGRLHLSVRTVESHVRHALRKVGLDNRTQLAAWAHEHSVANPRSH